MKLYIPLLFFGILYVFGQWGLFRRIYKILDKERPTIVAEVYNASLEQFFESEEEKNMYVVSLQVLAAKTKSDSKEFIVFLKDHYRRKESKDQGFIESVENKLANFLLDHYGEEIYTIAVYHIITTAAGKGAHIDISEAVPYEQFKASIDFLLDVGYRDIEKVILEKLDSWCSELLAAQYGSMIKSLWILLSIIIAVPLLEFFIYKNWVAPRYEIHVSEKSIEKVA